MLNSLLALAADPAAWLALVTLIVMEVVLGIDNLVFVSILSNKLPAEQRRSARRIGISLALVLRLVLLSTIAFVVGLTAPVFSLPLSAPLNEEGHPAFDLQFSWRDLILIAGGLFLLWKATTEIREKVQPHSTAGVLDTKTVAIESFSSPLNNSESRRRDRRAADAHAAVPRAWGAGPPAATTPIG